MERNKRSHLLFLLLALLHVCSSAAEADCPSLPDKGLTCYNDYNRTITCEWDSTFLSDRADTACTIYAERVHNFNGYHSSCTLEPVDVSRPAIQKCSLVFKSMWRFQTNHVLTISVNCNPVKHSLNISYKPVCHIKLNPPPKPEINFTTFSWFPQVAKLRFKLFHTQLEWKQQGQSWSDPSVQRTKNKQCEWDCSAEMDRSLLTPGERYEARVRVKTTEGSEYLSIWSEWSPTATWVSLIGEAKPTPPTPPPPPSEVTRGVLGTLACVVLVALLLLLVRTDKTTWIYIAKTFRGPPVPNPEKSSVNFQNWLSPHFTSESFHSFLRPVDIISVEVTSTVDAVAPGGPEAALQEKMRSESYDTTSSNFSNPSYSQLSPPPPLPPLPPLSSLTAGNLEACGTDTPYGPVGSHGVGKSAEQVEDEVRAKGEALLQLLSKRSNNSESVLVISDYEKAEKPQTERLRLQSLDSGVCSGEEVSQESLEADSINVNDCQDDGPEGRGEREGGDGKEVSFHKLFGGMLDKGSIQVCSGYEQVQKLQADGAELPSLDSGISSGSEEQLSQEESLEEADKSTEATSLLFPPPSPPPPSALACSSPTFTPPPLKFCVAGLSAALPPHPSQVLERTRSVEPSGDGYMPVRQEQS